MKLYEGMFVLNSYLKAEELTQLTSEIEVEIKKLKGEIVQNTPLGKKRFATPIDKQVEGYYQLVFFKLSPDQLEVLNRKLLLNEKILRSLVLSSTEQTLKKSSEYVEAEKV